VGTVPILLQLVGNSEAKKMWFWWASSNNILICW